MWRKASLRMTRVIEIGVLVTEAVRHVAIRPPETTVLDGDQFGMCNGCDSILASTVFVFQSSLETAWGAEVLYWIFTGLVSYSFLKSMKWQRIKI